MGKALLSAHSALLVKCYVKTTSDTTIKDGKVYYKLETSGGSIYVPVANPVASEKSSYFDIVADGTSSASEAFVQVCCIKDVPDQGDPELVETTDLCDDAQTYIEGLKTNELMAFTANFNQYVMKAINDYIKGTARNCAIVFGDTAGKDGKFTFDAYVSARLNGFGVNEVREMTINVIPNTDITQVLPA